MIGQTAVNLLKRRLSRNTNASSDFEDWILDELNAAQDRLEILPVLPQFLLSERAFIDVTINEQRVILPSDFLRENDPDDMQIEDTATGTFYNLDKDQMDQMRDEYSATATGRPEKYAYQGTYFRLMPTPDKNTYRLWMTYFKKDPVITLVDENNWLRHYPDLVISEAGLTLATILQNQVALTYFDSLRKQQGAAMLVAEAAKIEANLNPNPEN